MNNKRKISRIGKILIVLLAVFALAGGAVAAGLVTREHVHADPALPGGNGENGNQNTEINNNTTENNEQNPVVTFDGNGKTDAWTLDVEKGKTIGDTLIDLEPSEQNAIWDKIYASISEPGKVYHLAGWSLEQNEPDWDKWLKLYEDQITDNVTYYAQWQEYTTIAEVNVTLEAPVAGEETKTEQVEFGDGMGWDITTQTNRPSASVSETSCFIGGEDGQDSAYWVSGDETYEPFVGTFVEGNIYWANIGLSAEEGYVFTEETVVNVNGEALSNNGYDGEGGSLNLFVDIEAVAEPDPDQSIEGLSFAVIDLAETEPGHEYIVLPKGVQPAEEDWANAILSLNGEAITFGPEYKIEPGKEYSVYHRTPGDATHEPSEPSCINVKAARGASSDVLDGVNADGGVAPMTDDNGCFKTKDGGLVRKGDDGNYYMADENGNIPDGAEPLKKNTDGSLSDSDGKIEFVPAVMVVGLNPEADDNVKGKLDSVPEDEEYINNASPLYDAEEHDPSVYDNSVLNQAGVPSQLEKGKDYTIEYYRPEDIDSSTGLPKEGAKPLNTTDPDADDYAFDAGELVAVVNFQGDYAGTISTPVKIQKRTFHVVTPSDSKEYDGKPLSSPEPSVYITDERGSKVQQGLIGDQTVEVEVTGSITDPGETKNTFKLRFKGESEGTQEPEPRLSLASLLKSVFGPDEVYADFYNGITQNGEEPTAKRGNYDVVMELGTLTVRPKKYSLTTDVTPEEAGMITLYDANGAVVDTAVAGEEVTLKVTANEGYILDSLSCTDAAYDPVTLIPQNSIVDEWTLTMPASDVKATAKFKKVTEIRFAGEEKKHCDAGESYALIFTVSGMDSVDTSKITVTVDGRENTTWQYTGSIMNLFTLLMNESPGDLTAGDHDVVVSFSGDDDHTPCSGTFTLTITTDLTGISINSDNARKDYNEGDELDVTGLTLTVIKSDKNTENVAVTADMVSGFDSSTTGMQILTVTYEGFTDTFEAEVRHNWEEDFTIDKKPTCTEKGSKSIHCKHCDAVKDSTVIDPHGHDMGEWKTISAPDCTDKGRKERICSICKHKETRDIDPKGHEWEDDFTVDKEPTCTEEGSKSIHCKHCNAIKDSTVIESHGHDWGEWKVTKASTETEEGIEERICKNDPKHKETRSIPVTGHVHKLSKVDAKEADCESEGNIEYWVCDKGDNPCGRIFADEACKTEINIEDTVVKATEHKAKDAAKENEIVATCETDGSYDEAVYCEYCGKELSRNRVTVNATGHDWGEWTVTKEPAENEDGIKTRVCSHNKDHIDTKGIPATGHVHDLEKSAKKEAGCTIAGLKEHYKCKKCGLIYTDSNGSVQINEEALYIPPAGHTEGEKTKRFVTEATCEKAGSYYEEIHCTVCGELLKSELMTEPALGHDWDEWKETKAATCTTPGEMKRVCKRNSEHFDTGAIPATGHDWGEWKVTKTATETEEGTEERSCKNDPDHKESQIIPAKRQDSGPEDDKDEITYNCTYGNGNIWTKGSGVNSEFTFTRMEDDESTFDHYTELYADGRKLTDSEAVVSRGSLKVSLLPEFLETLAVGEHTLRAEFDDGSAQAGFTVLAKADPGQEPEDDPNGGEEKDDPGRQDNGEEKDDPGKRDNGEGKEASGKQDNGEEQSDIEINDNNDNKNKEEAKNNNKDSHSSVVIKNTTTDKNTKMTEGKTITVKSSNAANTASSPVVVATKGNKASNAAATGDTNNNYLWLLLLIMPAAVITGSVIVRKRKIRQ